MTHQTPISAAAAHYTGMAAQARDELGRFAEVPRFEFLNRYFTDADFAAQIDAERDANSIRQNMEWDASQIRQFARKDDEPGFVSAFRARVETYARAEQDYKLLMTAGYSHEDAQAIIAMGQGAGNE